MQETTLQPNQLIVPGEYELGNETALRIYFDVCDKGFSRILPPVVIVRSDLISRETRRKKLRQRFNRFDRRGTPYLPSWENIDDSRGLYGRLEPIVNILQQEVNLLEGKISQSPYYLIDGNHRTAAETLTYSPIYALELETSKDLAEIRRMAKRGNLPPFRREETSIRKLVHSCENYILDHIDDMRTVEERVKELVSNRDLPKYMIDRYLRHVIEVT